MSVPGFFYRQTVGTAIWSAFALCLVATAHASDKLTPAINLGIDVTHYDNVFNRADNEVSDLSVRLTGAADLNITEHFYSAQLSYQGYETDYEDDSFEDDNGISGTGQILFGRANSVVKWLVQNSEQQTRLFSVSSNTPDNLSQRSTFVTGPLIHWRASHVDDIDLSVQHQSITIDKSIADTTTDMANLSWTRRVSRLTEVSISGNYSDTEQKINPDINYSQIGFFIRLSQRFARGSVSLDVGESRVTDYRNLGEIDDNTYQLNFLYTIAGGNLNLSANRILADSSIGDQSFFEDSDFGNQELDIELRNRFSIDYSNDQSIVRTRISLGGSYNDSKSQTQNTSEETQTAYTELSRELNLRTQITLQYRYSESSEAFGQRADKQEQQQFQFRLSHQLTPTLNVGCGLSNDKTTGAFGYTANQYHCSINYQLL